MIYFRIMVYLIGVLIFTFGIAMVIKVQHLGVHPWEVLGVGLYQKFGLTIGTWNIIIGFFLIGIALILDKSYVNIATFFNAIFVGVFVDIYLSLDFIPVTHTWTDIIIIITGIVIVGFGGGLYNAAGMGSGPRDGFMLSISDKIGLSISLVRIIIETIVLIIGFLIGGPVFFFTFIFTFIQSPVFQYTYLKFLKLRTWLEIYTQN